MTVGCVSFQGQWSFVRTVPFVGLYLRCRCARTELITPDLICPSTYQLLRNSGGDSKPDLSFDKSASPKHLFSSAHWTKDHPLEQVIGEPSRPVLTRNQLRTDDEICIYALSVSTMEPSNVKEAMTDPRWIDSMQEELLQFKRLDV
ncbi:hypothetical protein Tco_0856293 [Tanacetum coccineum]|uniref:Gag-Pol polyprotein n=1 Tax=Tanacetum coccineum TaxID=301880 RepID=A0ABQ5B3R1_9ASTR